ELRSLSASGQDVQVRRGRLQWKWNYNVVVTTNGTSRLIQTEIPETPRRNQRSENKRTAVTYGAIALVNRFRRKPTYSARASKATRLRCLCRSRACSQNYSL